VGGGGGGATREGSIESSGMCLILIALYLFRSLSTSFTHCGTSYFLALCCYFGDFLLVSVCTLANWVLQNVKNLKDPECMVISVLLMVGNKKPTQKNHPKKPKKTLLKNPPEMFLFCFLGFFKFLIFFVKIIQTFLFEKDFL
jgi:hypothetical protein